MKTGTHAKREKERGHSCPPNGGLENPPSVDGLRALARQLVQIKQQAAALGLFTNDRELLECPSCGFLEDVTFEGFLITYKKDGKDQRDSGLRFRPLGKTRFACPACGAACHLPTEEELPKELEQKPAIGRSRTTSQVRGGKAR